MFDGLLLSVAMADGEAAAAAPHPSVLENLFPYIFMFFVLYFFILRPNQRRAQTHKSFLETLKRGDSVLTSGGILGTIEGLTEQFVTLQIASDVKIRVLKAQIASGVSEELVKR